MQIAALALAAPCGGGAGGGSTRGPGGTPPPISSAPAPALELTGYGGVRGLVSASPLLESNHRRTVTGDGFFAVELRGEAKTATGGSTGEHVNILAFRVGNQVADLLGWQASGEQGCLDEVLDTFSAWQGTSWWDVSGNKLTIWPIGGSKAPFTRHFRIFDEYNTAEASGWRTYWYRLDVCGGVPCEGWSVLEAN